MSIEQDTGRKQLVCDNCNEGHKQPNGRAALYNDDEFDIMISDAKEDGWKFTKTEDGKWEHTCPDCQE